MRRWLVFLGAWIAGILALYVLWALAIVASGGAIDECDRGDCGSLGEWWYAHSKEVFAVILALGAAGAVLAVRTMDKRG